MDRLPLGGTGKVDRYRLPDPGSLPSAAGEDDAVAPRNRIEEELAAIWRELLMRERVGIHDNFFALGGHSLTVVQLTTRIRDAFGIDMPIQRVFEAPTLSELALVVLQMEAAAANPEDLARWLAEIESEEIS
jgi:acyl carrier protein